MGICPLVPYTLHTYLGGFLVLEGFQRLGEPQSTDTQRGRSSRYTRRERNLKLAEGRIPTDPTVYNTLVKLIKRGGGSRGFALGKAALGGNIYVYIAPVFSFCF